MKIQTAVRKSVRQDMFAKQYGEVFQGDAQWNSIKVPAGDRYTWENKSTLYQAQPRTSTKWSTRRRTSRTCRDIRVLASPGRLRDTDHISPAGNTRRIVRSAVLDVARGSFLYGASCA